MAWLALFVWAAPLRAQEPDTTLTAQADTTLAAIDTTSSVLVQESLLPYKMQSRYRPVNRPFHKGGFLANSYASVLGAGFRQMADNYSYGIALGGAFGKWLAPWHGVEAGLDFSRFMDNFDATRLTQVNIRASYLFNLSAYVDGYDPDRLVEFYPRAGLGLGMLFVPGEGTHTGLSAHLGIDADMHIFPGIDLVVQPVLEMQKDARQLARMDVWRKYILSMYINCGVRFTLDKERVGGDPGNDWFFTASTGPQVQTSKYLLTENRIRFGKAIGLSTMVGAGRYYADAFALRAQLGIGWHYWKEIQEGETDEYDTPLPPARFRSAYFVGRVEGAVDILRLMGWISLDHPFSLSVYGGPEVGLIHKQDPYYKDIVEPYAGVTLAPQVKYRLAGGFSAYLEPRVSFVPYSAYAFKTSTVNVNYYDAVVSLSIGVEYRLTEK